MKAFGLLVALGIGYYIYAMNAETSDVEELCARYPVGTPADGFAATADGLSGDLMGPMGPDDKSGKLTYIYCSPMTMCDVSCSVDIEDGVVTRSDFHRL